MILECNDEELLKNSALSFPNVNVTNKLWKVTSKNSITENKTVFITPYVSICTGHHCKPKNFNFPGEETFLG
jgi:cation diffusion facilitator CzcD-associated flavoprotein CzcO